jgi:hypothetical protein
MGLAAFNLKRRQLAAAAEAAAAKLTPTPKPAANLNPEPLKPAAPAAISNPAVTTADVAGTQETKPDGAAAGAQTSGATAEGGTLPPAADGGGEPNVAEMTIPEVIEAVKSGKVSRERAAELEAAGKNRQTLIKRLTEELD